MKQEIVLTAQASDVEWNVGEPVPVHEPVLFLEETDVENVQGPTVDIVNDIAASFGRSTR